MTLTIHPYDEGDTRVSTYNVTFVHHYAVVTATVEALSENDAIGLASDMLTDYYGWDLSRWQAEAETV